MYVYSGILIQMVPHRNQCHITRTDSILISNSITTVSLCVSDKKKQRTTHTCDTIRTNVIPSLYMYYYNTKCKKFEECKFNDVKQQILKPCVQ